MDKLILLVVIPFVIASFANGTNCSLLKQQKPKSQSEREATMEEKTNVASHVLKVQSEEGIVSEDEHAGKGINIRYEYEDDRGKLTVPDDSGTSFIKPRFKSSTAREDDEQAKPPQTTDVESLIPRVIETGSNKGNTQRETSDGLPKKKRRGDFKRNVVLRNIKTWIYRRYGYFDSLASNILK